MSVITISRQYGSGGDEIVDRICQVLGYHRFSKLHISQAAAEAGLSEREIIDYSEENYKVKNFIDRLLGRSRQVGEARIWREDAQGTRITELEPISEEHALALVKGAVEAAYRAGDVVVVGRAGQVILKDRPGVLHVRIIAPMEDRIQRVRGQYKLERRVAQDLIDSRDAASADYLKTFFGVDWAAPLLYHIILNTAGMELEDAAHAIVELARSIQAAAVPA